MKKLLCYIIMMIVVLLMTSCTIMTNQDTDIDKDIGEDNPRLFTLYEQTIPQPITYKAYEGTTVSVKQGEEYLNDREIIYKDCGLSEVRYDATFGTYTTVSTSMAWDKYKQNVWSQDAQKEYGIGCYINEGLWKALSNVIIETENWRITFVTPMEVLTTSKVEDENYMILIDNIVLNNEVTLSRFGSCDRIGVRSGDKCKVKTWNRLLGYESLTDMYLIEKGTTEEGSHLYDIRQKIRSGRNGQNVEMQIVEQDVVVENLFSCNTITFTLYEIPCDDFIVDIKEIYATGKPITDITISTATK